MMRKDQVAGPDVGDVIADRLRPTDDLVSEYGADFLGEIPRHQIAGTDAAGGRADEDFAIRLKARPRHGGDVEALRSCDEGLTHDNRVGGANRHETLVA